MAARADHAVKGLAGLLVVVALPATPALAILAGRTVNVGLGWLVFGSGVAVVLLAGRGSLGAWWPALVVAFVTWVPIALSCLVGFFFLLAHCGQPNAPWIAVAAGAVVYTAIAFWSLRERRLWGFPVAVVLGFVVGITLFDTLPGVLYPASDCSFGS